MRTARIFFLHGFLFTEMIVYLSGYSNLVGSSHQFRVLFIQHITKNIFRNAFPEKVGFPHRTSHGLEKISYEYRLHIVARFKEFLVLLLCRVRPIRESFIEYFAETKRISRSIERTEASHIVDTRMETILYHYAAVFTDHVDHLLSAFAVASMESEVVMAFEFNS